MKRLALRLTIVVALLCGFAFVWLPSVTAGISDLVNPGFEAGNLTGWTVGYAPDTVSVVGAEDLQNSYVAAWSTGTVHVAPHEGTYMARLGQPSSSTSYSQLQGANELWQTFVVTSSTLRFAYNLCSYDTAPGDYFNYKVAVPGTTSEQRLAYFATTAPADGNTNGDLRCGGWQEVTVDLAGYLGQTATLYFSAGGNSGGSDMRRTFAYVDTVPVSAPAGSPPGPVAVQANMKVTPQTVNANAKSAPSVITVHVTLPFAAREVDLSTVTLRAGATEVPMVGRPVAAGKYLTLKFSRQAFLEAIEGQTGEVQLTLDGLFGVDGSFTAADTVQVIAPTAD